MRSELSTYKLHEKSTLSLSKLIGQWGVNIFRFFKKSPQIIKTKLYLCHTGGKKIFFETLSLNYVAAIYWNHGKFWI